MGGFSIFHWLIVLTVSVLPAFLPLIINRPQGANLYGPAPRMGMNFAQALATCFTKYVDFNGRASRSEFWWFALFVFVVGVVVNILSEAGFGLARFVPYALILPHLAVASRRLHDHNRSGWWQLIGFGFGLIPLIFMLAQPSSKTEQDMAKVFD